MSNYRHTQDNIRSLIAKTLALEWHLLSIVRKTFEFLDLFEKRSSYLQQKAVARPES